MAQRIVKHEDFEVSWTAIACWARRAVVLTKSSCTATPTCAAFRSISVSRPSISSRIDSAPTTISTHGAGTGGSTLCYYRWRTGNRVSVGRAHGTNSKIRRYNVPVLSAVTPWESKAVIFA